MRLLNYLYILLPMIVVLVGCDQDQMLQYEEKAAIYFENDVKGQKDSLVYSFFYQSKEVIKDTIRVKVCIMGTPADYDRPISLVQVNEGEDNAAVAGVDYVSFDDPELIDSICIHAGEVTADVPIVLLRDKNLDSKREVRLQFAVAQNKYFRPGINAWRLFLVKINDIINKPDNWDKEWSRIFGASWGPEKMRFIIQKTGLTDFTIYPEEMGYSLWLKNTAINALNEYNEAHPDEPLCEANGKPVDFYN